MLGVSIAYLVMKLGPRWYNAVKNWRKGSDPAYQPLLGDSSGDNNNNNNKTDNDDDWYYTDYETDVSRMSGSYGSILESRRELAARNARKSLLKPQVAIATVARPMGDRIRVALECVFVATQTALALAAICVPGLASEWKHYAYVPKITFAFWFYCFALVSLRLPYLGLSKTLAPSGGLWYHSTFMYGFAFLISVVDVYSSRIHPVNGLSRNYHLLEFLLSTGLLYLNFSSTTGNKPARLYLSDEPGVEPSVEPVSSLFAVITFSWVWPIMWKGYWQPLEMRDVWDLREDDHAFFILRKFRTIRARVGFAMKMVIHFRRELVIAGVWAIAYSLTTFAPPTFLRLILEYVADPSSRPPTVAWLYVAGIFVFNIIDSVFTGQALFIGRRICIRMRAIVIGEVYAKALRRKAGAGGESSLAKKDDDDDKSKKKTSKQDGKDNGEEDAKDEGQANLGAIINLMAVDAFKVSEICGYLHYFVSAVLTITIAIYYLYFIISWSAFVGALGMLAVMPLNYWFAKEFGKFQDQLMAISDERVEKTNELLQSIRIIKFFAWEDKFAQGVLKVRERELKVLRNRYILWAFGALIWFMVPLVITLLSFGCFTLIQGRTLTTPIAFTALAVFNILKYPLDQLADMLSNVIQAKVSVDRIEKFLNERETQKYEQLEDKPRGPNSPYIGFENATFSWGVSQPKFSDNDDDINAGPRQSSPAPAAPKADFKLRDVDVSFHVGELNVVIGPTGSGKTSLMMALLGEMELESGRVYLPGATSRETLKPDPVTGFTENVAYCAQQAWLLNDTLKNNILFASEFNESRYRAVIEACALTRDLEILEAGDQTEIGEKGITLSGGQKQRISLARALYSSARHLILDDCLSAVDSHTAAWIYENALTGPVSEGRTIILVSHNVALTIGKAAYLVMMDNGRIAGKGTPAELATSGKLGTDKLIMQSATNSRDVSRVPSEANVAGLAARKSPLSAANKDSSSSKQNLETELAEAARSNRRDSVSLPGDPTMGAGGEHKPSTLIKEEERARGHVNLQVYWLYLRSLGSVWWWVFTVVIFVVPPAVQVLQSWWMREWAMSGMDEAERSLSVFSSGSLRSPVDGTARLWYAPIQLSKEREDEHGPIYYLVIYGLIGLALMITQAIKDLTMFLGGLRASREAFEKLLDSVLHAKVRFFDSTPIGRIMNRFSKDMESIDQDLSPVLTGTVGCFVSAASILVVVIAVTPQFLIASFFIVAMYWYIAAFYLATSRELKRLDSVSKSPVYQHFGETLVGVSTIRAYGDERRFIRENLKRIDTNNRPFFFMWVSNRWLSLRVDTAAAFVSFFAAAFILLSLDRIDSGLAGLSLSFALSFNENVLWIVRLYAMVEMSMNSVERVQEYMDVDKEAPHVIEGVSPPPNWPDKGEIEVTDLSLRYAPELPRVIKNVTFKVSGRSKVGIVGRTGAGKSTIITALFRLLEADSGKIVIDGVDISTLGLRDLRRGLAIIPQDPTLFTGTIRSNLDPFNEYSDLEIFEALRRVHLIAAVPEPGTSAQSVASDENANQFLNLDNPVTEGGGNLSQGQRQLMCLARSLLKSPRILLLDEATASIDYDTDAAIQKTIREEFTDTTILTIAHRLRSIADYDKILVLDAGKAVEYDQPYSLLENHDSVFYGMCQRSGEFEALLELAKDAYKP